MELDYNKMKKFFLIAVLLNMLFDGYAQTTLKVMSFNIHAGADASLEQLANAVGNRKGRGTKAVSPRDGAEHQNGTAGGIEFPAEFRPQGAGDRRRRAGRGSKAAGAPQTAVGAVKPIEIGGNYGLSGKLVLYRAAAQIQEIDPGIRKGGAVRLL